MHLNYGFILEDFPVVLKALRVTFALTLISYLGAFLIACLMGSVILHKTKILYPILVGFNTIVKGIPLILQLLFCYYGIPQVIKAISETTGLITYDPKNLSYFGFAAVAFSVNYGAYMTDVVVSSFKAVDHGQREAAASIGMTTAQGILYITGPQALAIAIPGLSNYFMWLLKATSLASITNVFEMLAVARASTADNYAILEGYIVAAIIYWGVCLIAESLLKKLNQLVNHEVKEHEHGRTGTYQKEAWRKRNLKGCEPAGE
ncbi:MAG: amino acid ABC transporter permease [Lachnospiraceae bacterium]|nr:amino acid ABC transporter permease [Lachnospiraceae bacterium]